MQWENDDGPRACVFFFCCCQCQNSERLLITNILGNNEKHKVFAATNEEIVLFIGNKYTFEKYWRAWKTYVF